MAIVVGAAYFPLTRIAAIRAHQDALLIGSGLVVSAAMGWATGFMGGPDRPQIHMLDLLVCGTIPMPLRARSRAVVTVLFAGAILGGYLVPFPEHLASPYLPVGVSMLICTIVVSITFGHMLYLLLRANFFQAALLVENNALLEERVAERTRELRELLSRLETTREEERNRIAREIHDELGQELTAQRLTLAIAEDCLDGEPDTARAKLGDMRVMLDRMMTTVRALIADLRPWILHDLGLGEAAQWLARRTEELSGLTCKLVVSGDLASLDPERSAAVFRILQESLNNVTKHAEARTVARDRHRDDRRRPGAEGGGRWDWSGRRPPRRRLRARRHARARPGARRRLLAPAPSERRDGGHVPPPARRGGSPIRVRVPGREGSLPGLPTMSLHPLPRSNTIVERGAEWIRRGGVDGAIPYVDRRSPQLAPRE